MSFILIKAAAKYLLWYHMKKAELKAAPCMSSYFRCWQSVMQFLFSLLFFFFFYHFLWSFAIKCTAHDVCTISFVPDSEKGASVYAGVSHAWLFLSHANRCPRWNVESCPFPKRLCFWETWAALVTMAAWMIKRQRWSFRKLWARLPRYCQSKALH